MSNTVTLVHYTEVTAEWMQCSIVPSMALYMSAEIKAAYSPYRPVVTVIRGRACDKNHEPH